MAGLNKFISYLDKKMITSGFAKYIEADRWNKSKKEEWRAKEQINHIVRSNYLVKFPFNALE